MQAAVGDRLNPCDPSVWLRESSKEFAGLAGDETEWVRGHVYAAMANEPDAPSLIEQAREDLRTSLSPIVLAGLARYLRAARVDADWAPDLRAAAERIRYTDRYPDFVFDPAPSCCKPALTCREELELTLADVAARSGRCCQSPVASQGVAERCGPLPGTLLAARLEDQDAHRLTLGDVLAPGAAVLALFYTRCMNPQKCSLTVSRLARVAAEVPGLGCYGLSYDPAFDTAERLRGYGHDRGFPFAERARLMRCSSGWSELRKALGLKVGYGEATVNAHARELFLLRPDRTVWRLPPDWLTEPERIVELAAEPAQARC